MILIKTKKINNEYNTRWNNNNNYITLKPQNYKINQQYQKSILKQLNETI